MLKGEKIVCFGFPKWEGDYLKSTVQLMTELARHNEVLYVDYPYTLKDLIRGLSAPGSVPVWAVLGLRPRLMAKVLANGASIHLLRLPPFLPANWLNEAKAYDRLTRWNARLALWAVRRTLRHLGWVQPIVVNAFNPALGNALAGQLDEKLLVYYCYDEIGAAGWISKHGKRHEEKFLRLADLAIVSSAALREEKVKLSRHCELVENGVSLALFQPERFRPIPEEVPVTGSAPVIGYLGSVDERLDYNLLEYLAIVLPGHQFVFVGRIVDLQAARALEMLPNITFLGPRPPQQLASHVAGFSLGIIPFVRNELTAGIYPLKANEYLAMGKPVVSTDFSDLSSLSGMVHIADTYEGFRQAIEQALASDTKALQLARSTFARGNSWERRAAQFGNLLVDALKGNRLRAAGPALSPEAGITTSASYGEAAKTENR